LIDIPLNKALVAVEVDCCKRTPSECLSCHCSECAFEGNCGEVVCSKEDRKDGKNVMFKLVDWKGEVRVED